MDQAPDHECVSLCVMLTLLIHLTSCWLNGVVASTHSTLETEPTYHLISSRLRPTPLGALHPHQLQSRGTCGAAIHQEAGNRDYSACTVSEATRCHQIWATPEQHNLFCWKGSIICSEGERKQDGPDGTTLRSMKTRDP